MPKLISPNQSAFIKGRQLVDGVVAVNEFIDLARKLKRDCFIFKVDFEKPYDIVSWSFLEYMMMHFGFDLKWHNWIRAFEGLSSSIRRAEEIGMFKDFKVRINGLSVSHLQYADDTIFLGEASVENLWTLKTILCCFEMASGLKVNYVKSSVIGVNVSSDFLNLAERFLHCSVGSIPFTYLELPVGANP
ncbi:hypothetical protein TSUD_360500 [Trifolium subterraneum]|uniref:Uncharacterized protein n=1 Tax=Trifolium subterraneum TaxID=3900 RepID=A0A2Z6N1Q2_TRISU|nr:hypothetical protein TSUD_360500 [Trifolium subterraneum]